MKRIRRFRLSLRSLFTSGRKRPATPIEVQRAEWTFYINYIREDMIAFDVGAHVGELTPLFSTFCGPRGRVHLFEPNPAAFQRLMSLCETAGIKNTILNPVALSDREGTITLHVYDDEHSSWSTLAERPLHQYGIFLSPIGAEEVPTTTIDTYCTKSAVARIDLLKIDVEGAEYQVLLGARRMLEERRIRCIVFEFGQTTFDMGNDPDCITTYLRNMGYRIRNLVRGDANFPGGWSAADACYSMHAALPDR